MYYDLAKLSHSFNGKYEHIISDSFSCTVDYTSIQYELYVSEYQHKVTELFNERLGAQAGPKLDIINFIEATHFLSMASLHAERPDRQILMLVRAVEQMEALLQHCAPPTQRLEHRT